MKTYLLLFILGFKFVAIWCILIEDIQLHADGAGQREVGGVLHAGSIGILQLCAHAYSQHLLQELAGHALGDLIAILSDHTLFTESITMFNKERAPEMATSSEQILGKTLISNIKNKNNNSNNNH